MVGNLPRNAPIIPPAAARVSQSWRCLPQGCASLLVAGQNPTEDGGATQGVATKAEDV